ncbi:hypothetical protein [Colwellia sp. 12G3]|nr:hypothetical protein [Colwellia sp. 12G3]
MATITRLYGTNNRCKLDNGSILRYFHASSEIVMATQHKKITVLP